MDKLRLGWIGVGNMGTPMCRQLLRVGHAVTIFDVDASRVDALVAEGAIAAPSPAAVAAAADVIFSMVPNDQVLRAIIAGPDGILSAIRPPHAVIDMSTVSPVVSAEVAALLGPSGALYLRAPVSGSTASAASASLSIYCSGPRDGFERMRPLLALLGSKLTYAGGAEEARVLKLIINMLVVATPAILGEALAIGARSGLDWSAMIAAFGESAAGSPVIQYKTDMLKRRDWAAMAAVDLVSKDLDLALALGDQLGLALPLTSLVRQINRQVQQEGQGGLDFFALAAWPDNLNPKE